MDIPINDRDIHNNSMRVRSKEVKDIENILLVLFRHPFGLTREEIEGLVPGLKTTSSSARISELKEKGYLAWKTIENGIPARYERRRTASGHTAHVLILHPALSTALMAGKSIETAMCEFVERPREEKEDRYKIIQEFQALLDRWRPYHTEVFVWNVLRQLYDPTYPQIRGEPPLSPRAVKRIWAKREKVTT